jgi:hypothetical protein
LNAFAQTFASLDHLLPEWSTSIWDRLSVVAPLAAVSVEAAEVQANRVALAFVAGRAGEDDFGDALEAFAKEWRDAAEILRCDLMALRWEPCRSCGRTDMAVAVRDHDGIVRCGSCWGEFLRR